MGFMEFMFVLAIVIPLAVLMMYLINNLNGEMKEAGRDAENEESRDNHEESRRRSTEKSKNVRREAAPGPAWRGTQQRESKGFRERGSDSGSFRERYSRQVRNKQDQQERQEKPARQMSKRKRRKERKNRRKAREEER